jgi:hypothetical protein
VNKFNWLSLLSVSFVMMGEIGVHMPVSRLVRFRQSAAGNLAADAQVIEFFALCSKAGFRDTSVGRNPWCGTGPDR